MELIKVEAHKRTETGKSAARKLRREGLIPGVVYGLDRPPQSLTIRREVVERLQRLGRSVLVELYLDGEAPGEDVAAIVKEVQRHPVTWAPLAIDLQWVSLRQAVEVPVPLVTVGEPEGVKVGGILEQLLHEVTVRCLPTNIPEEIQVDVSGLQIGDSLHVSDLQPPEGVEILEEPETAVVHIAAPRIIEEEEEAAEAAEEVAEELAEGEEAAEEKAEEKAEEGGEEGGES